MRRIWGFGLLVLVMAGVVSAATPPGFGVSLNNATGGTAGGKLFVTADGTYTCPTTHKATVGVIVLIQNGKEVAGGPPLDSIDAKTLKWSVTKGPVTAAAGTYDVLARITFEKVNPVFGDLPFDVDSNTITGVKIG